MYISKYNDIYFAEGNVEADRIIKPVEILIGGCYSQCKSLDDVKERLSVHAKEIGANAIINFTYGQKAKFFSLDGVVFYGSGLAVILSKNIIDNWKRN